MLNAEPVFRISFIYTFRILSAFRPPLLSSVRRAAACAGFVSVQPVSYLFVL